jgi:hypothetical protein
MDLKKIVTKTRLQFVLNLIALTIVSSLNSAKAYADGLKSALVAGDIAFTSEYFNSGAKTNVGSALVELATKANSDVVTFEALQSPNTGKLKTYRFTKGTGAGATTMDIDIEKDLLNGTFELVTIVEGTGADAGKYFDGATEVGSSVGVTGAGVYMKYNSNAASDSPSFSYADMSSCIEYLTVGTQTGKVVTLSIDPQTHTITADIADGAIGKSKLASGVQASLDKADSAYQLPQTGIPSTDLASAVQTSLGKADSALQSQDLDEVTENELTAAWQAAMTAAETPANNNEQSGD